MQNTTGSEFLRQLQLSKQKFHEFDQIWNALEGVYKDLPAGGKLLMDSHMAQPENSLCIGVKHLPSHYANTPELRADDSKIFMMSRANIMKRDEAARSMQYVTYMNTKTGVLTLDEREINLNEFPEWQFKGNSFIHEAAHQLDGMDYIYSRSPLFHAVLCIPYVNTPSNSEHLSKEIFIRQKRGHNLEPLTAKHGEEFCILAEAVLGHNPPPDWVDKITAAYFEKIVKLHTQIMLYAPECAPGPNNPEMLEAFQGKALCVGLEKALKIAGNGNYPGFSKTPEMLQLAQTITPEFLDKVVENVRQVLGPKASRIPMFSGKTASWAAGENPQPITAKSIMPDSMHLVKSNANKIV